MSALVAKGITRTIAGRAIVADVDLVLEKGEAVSLVGPSGCGKTTLLHVLGMLDRPDGGTVHLGDEDAWSLGDGTRAQMRLERIGFVFQQNNLFDAMTALDNVALPAWRSSGSRRAAYARANELLDEFGLAKVKHTRAAGLSGGEAQRVAIARALVNAPEIILADEPTGSLDSAATETVIDALLATCTRGTSLLVVTHDLEVAASAMRTIAMRDGRIVSSS